MTAICIRASQDNTSLAHMITRPMSPDDVSNAGSRYRQHSRDHTRQTQAIPGVFANMTTFRRSRMYRARFWNAGTYATVAAQVGVNLAVGSEETESANTIIECIIDHCKSLSEKDDAISITEVIQAYDILFDGMTASGDIVRTFVARKEVRVARTLIRSDHISAIYRSSGFIPILCC